jgi:hypothetical protein
MMKKTYVVVALALVLGGCASIRIGDQGHQRLVVKPDPGKPNILISGKSIVVDQEPLVLTRANAGAAITARDGNDITTISWALPLFSDYVFPVGAIVIGAYTEPSNGQTGKPPAGLTCVPGEKVYSCSYNTPTPQNPPVKYKYSIKVKPKAGSGVDEVEGLDPTIWN